VSERAFRRHRLAFILVNAALAAANLATGAPWWAFWPLVLWSIALMIHYLVYRSARVDDTWVEERVLDLQAKSYDLGHMQAIREHPAPAVGKPADSPPAPPNGP